MIIKFILKHWKKVFDVLLVVAIAIAAYFFLTKFMFGTKTKLHNTANMVSSIKDIGELVTAEYYGEVIASLEETELDLISVDSINQVSYDWFIEIKLSINDIIEEDSKKSKQKELLNELITSVSNETNNDDTYEKFISYLISELSISQRLIFKEESTKRVIKHLYNEILKNKQILPENQFNNYLLEGAYRTTLFSEYLKEDKRNQLGRKKLSIVGRGWVKAGFDFGKITEENFYFNEEQKTIHLLGFEPHILDSDINPWFIPENRIPGFDIVSSKGNVNFKDAQKVKIKCTDKLRYKAVEAGILERAKEYGEETLLAFFSLLVEEGKIEKVVFHSDEFEQLYDIVAKDSLIDYNEATFLYKKINNQIKEISAAKKESFEEEYINKKINLLIGFINKLKGVDYGEKNLNVKFNYYFAAANHLIKHKTIVINQAKRFSDTLWQNDSVLLSNMRFKFYTTDIYDNVSYIYPEIIEKDSLFYWFYNSYPLEDYSELSFLGDYNKFAKVLNDSVKWIKITQDSIINKGAIFDTGRKFEFIERKGNKDNNNEDIVAYSQKVGVASYNNDFDFFPLKQYAVGYKPKKMVELIENNDYENIIGLNYNTKYEPEDASEEKQAIKEYLKIQVQSFNDRSPKEKAVDITNKLSSRIRQRPRFKRAE